MLRTRVMPVLLLRDESLVKTVKFGHFTYIGDPCNTVRIFNELEVDELIFLDISATRYGRSPNLKVLADIAKECFMPLAYGGGVKSFDEAREIFQIGFEKISINSAAIDNPQFIHDLAEHFGSQAVIVSIDVKRDILGRRRVWSKSGTYNTKLDPVLWAKEVERLGAGEILLTSIEREGTWSGFDLELLRDVADAVTIPVIAHGGAGSIDDIGLAISSGHASAVALGSMITFQKKGMGVLVSYPDETKLTEVLS
jgi:cyclase